jgi:putative GTP pyrophosphokinase
MTWPTPQFSKAQINRAGEILRSENFDFDKWLWAYEVLGNWRGCHGYPINTFQATLRSKIRPIDPDAIVAQRLKRTPSIISKLRRFDSMKLARMQDIGGLRAVVKTIKMVRELESSYDLARFGHELVSKINYITNPKTSGYRSIHLVFKYHKPSGVSDYNGLMIELQLRTRVQHAWATAVETMGMLLDHSLKSSEGPDRWLNFFALASSALAHLEGTESVPGYESLSRGDTYLAVLQEADELQVIRKLKGFTVALKAISAERRRGAYHLIVLDLAKLTVQITGFPQTRLDEANRLYTQIEERADKGEDLQAVLVAAGSIDSLKKAYPNFFLDANEFVSLINRIRTLATKTRG